MAITNRKSFLAFIREDLDDPYTGKEDLAEVKSWIIENGHKLVQDGKEIDVDAIWAVSGKSIEIKPAKKAAPITTDDEDDGESDGQREDRLSGKSKTMPITTGEPSTKTLAPWQRERMAARKSYDRKAARGESALPDSELAELTGAMMRSAACGARDYPQKANDLEIMRKASSVNNNVVGGALVAPPEMSQSLIELREQYGVAPREVGITSMSSDRYLFARNLADQTVYWLGENTAGTESDPSTDNPQLTANKLMGICVHPNEILNDNAISIADMSARSFARESARKIDLAAFIGDGTATYGGFVGMGTAISNLDTTTRANIAGAFVGTGDLFTEIVEGDLISTMSLCPAYAQPTAKWYGHSTAFFNIVQRLGMAKGGVTYTETTSAGPTFRAYGMPFVFVQAMSSQGLAGTEYRNKPMLLYGDLSLGMKIGIVRNSLAFDISDQRYFEKDQVAFRFRERVAILAHDPGNASSTESLRVAGPVVTLLGKAS